MFHYRVYLLNNHGSISSGADVECDTDQDACVLAQLMLNDSHNNQAEVWSGTRRVGKVVTSTTSPPQARPFALP